MDITGPAHVFTMGCAGGAVAEVLHWWNLRKQAQFPKYGKRPIYWVLTTVMILLGGFVSWLYFGEKAEGLLAVHVGLSTPLILQKLATSVPQAEGSRAMIATPDASPRSFFTW